MTDDEISRLCACLSAYEWLPLRVSSETGLRIGDVLKIKVSDIDEKGRLTYCAQKTGKDGIIKLKNSTVKAMLGGAGKEFVFESPIVAGQPLSRQAAWQRIKRAAYRAGVDVNGCSPHSLRKAYAVALYARKGIGAVREALQHSSDDVTRIYALSDWSTGENANLPLRRADIELIIAAVKKSLEMDKAC